jgi:hypothetical protein
MVNLQLDKDDKTGTKENLTVKRFKRTVMQNLVIRRVEEGLEIRTLKMMNTMTGKKPC